MEAWIKDTAAPAPAPAQAVVVVVAAAELNAAVTARQYSGLDWIRTPLHAGGGELPLVVPDITDSFQECVEQVCSPIVVMTQELEHQKTKTQKST